MTPLKTFSLILFFIFTFSYTGFAQEDAPTGLSIIQKQQKLQSGYVDYQAKGTLLLKNKSGALDTKRIFDIQEIEFTKEAPAKSLIKLNFPPDLKGTGLLSIKQSNNQTTQYLYLPSLKQTREIISTARGGRFLDSEFYYEDLIPYSWQSYDYELDSQIQLDGKDCYVIRLTPHSGLQSLYGQILQFVEKERYITIKTDFYSNRGEHIKTAHFTNYQKFSGRFWRPTLITMSNQKSGRRSELHLDSISLNTGLVSKNLNKESLER
jgi:hypothetical protein